jgi:hypothetical protein
VNEILTAFGTGLAIGSGVVSIIALTLKLAFKDD